MMTCVIWGLVSAVLIRVARIRLSLDIFSYRGKLGLVNWLACLGMVAICVILSTIDWNGLKVIREFQSNGMPRFIFQYLYYVGEAVLIFLIIVFGQKAGECFFGHTVIPWGGVLLALTWGFAHMLTQGSVIAGLMGGLGGILYGALYLSARRNVYVSYGAVLLAFLL
jgi:hypothetical protein